MRPITRKSLTHRFAAVAVVGAFGLTAAACGSSSSTASKPSSSTPSSSAAPAGGASTTDMVTAIPHLTGVGTTVNLDPATLMALTSLGVKPTPYGTAKLSGTAITFPITDGYAEIHSNHSHTPGWIEGSIEHGGSGLTLTKGSTVVTASDFVVEPGNSMLYATIGGKPDVPLLFLDGAAVKVSMANGDVVLDGTKAELTAAAASALNMAFGTTALKAGIELGTVHLVAAGAVSPYTDKVTEISRLSGVSTSVALDPSTLMALTSLGVKPAPVGSAKLANGSITFPITGGMAVIHSDMSYKPGYIDGVLIHQDSGLSLTKGSTTVALTSFTVDPGNSELYGNVNGKEFPQPLLNLNGSGVKVSMSGGDVHLDGTVATLSAPAAAALNMAFGTTALKAGTPLGVVHIIASGS